LNAPREDISDFACLQTVVHQQAFPADQLKQLVPLLAQLPQVQPLLAQLPQFQQLIAKQPQTTVSTFKPVGRSVTAACTTFGSTDRPTVIFLSIQTFIFNSCKIISFNGIQTNDAQK
jgi:hypothetical protein